MNPPAIGRVAVPDTAAAPRNRRRIAILGVVSLVAGLISVSLQSSVAQAATVSPPTTDVVANCPAPAPGQATCLSVRRTDVQQTAALAAAAPGQVVPMSSPSGFGPASLVAAYGLDASRGSGQTVAIVDAYNNPNAESDLAVYRAQYGLPACTTANGCFRKVNQNGAASPLPATNSGWAGEIALDVDMVSAICPQCNILLLEANSSYLSDLGTAVNTAVSLGAKFVSNSYGGGDTSGYDSYYNHPGVAITASTGDNGYGVSYPASSPYVTAVGGTSLSIASTPRGFTETAWAGAGSGCSTVANQPTFQIGVATGCAKRAVADVSAVANPNTGVAVYNGGWGVYGGTSASSPIIASVYALAGTPGASDYPNTYPYLHTGDLNDVTSGTNGTCTVHQLCSSVTGWDGPTGLGTPNTANSFSASGVVGPITKLGASVSVSNPLTPGLGTTVTMTPSLPAGDAVATIAWKSARADCTFASATSAQTTLTCNAALATTSSITVTVTDTAGATKVVTSAITFSIPTVKRALSVAFSVASQSGSSASVCTGAGAVMRAVVTDTATGAPVKGVTVTFTKKNGTAALATAGSALTNADGVAAGSIVATTAMTLTVSLRSVAVGAFSAMAGSNMLLVASKCSPTVTASADKSASYYGDAVTITGTLTRPVASQSIPLAGATVAITEPINGKVTSLGSAVVATDGSYTAVVHPTVSGTITVSLAGGAAWNATSAVATTLVVSIPTTSLSASADRTQVGYAGPVLVTGTLTRNAGGVVTGATAGTISVRETLSTGAVIALAAAAVAKDGTWKATALPKTAGTISAVFLGAAGLPAASATVGAIDVGTWSTAVSVAAATTQVAGLLNTVTGTATRSYAGSTIPAPGLAVKVYLQTPAGASLLVGSVTTNAAGAYAVRTYAQENGTLVAKVAAVTGYTEAISSAVSLSVTTKVAATVAAVALHTAPAVVKVSVLAPRAIGVTVQRLVGTSWVDLGSATTAANGTVAVSVTGLPIGRQTLRVISAGDARADAGVSANFAVTVR
ncbi:hypothetical protein SAMN05892883_4006 [Jatrophihabitans sp. GAS493]|uniref:hypothetical protein n=1 Tax=Jatrophihabitans sp. GAS493 TaxID=1907575 RepID=UPI000BB88BF6|nr:hypothetical protein [Jatrophihabitans sp. GAS493]SOD74814.1 hypothetical protein SAMN05892883_4006 [Jatrophihabitans sp. GAS493]